MIGYYPRVSTRGFYIKKAPVSTYKGYLNGT